MTNLEAIQHCQTWPEISPGFRNLLPPVVEKAWLVGLHYDNIKQVLPVLPNYIVHASISTIRKLKDVLFEKGILFV